jgi:mRNA interferase MazF
VTGSEQSGRRPVLVLQNPVVSQYSVTVVAIPFTTNLRRADLPSAVLIPEGSGGLRSTSVLLCHQIRVLDRTRLLELVGTLPPSHLTEVERAVLLTLGISQRRV